MIENLLLLITGMIGGLIAGLTGIGTGFVMLAVIPMVLVNFGVPEASIVSATIANAIFATFVSSFANVAATIKTKSFYVKETFWAALGAVIFSLLVFETVVKSEFYSRALFNGVIVFFMFIIIFQTFKKLRLSNPQDEQVTKPKLFFTGAIAGGAAALTGLGGGTLIIPLLNLWQKVDIMKAKSISFGTIFAIAFWLTLHNLFLEPPHDIPSSKGLIIFPLIIPISIGVLIGSPLGVLFSKKISSRSVTLLFLIIISLVAIQKIAELVWMEMK